MDHSKTHEHTPELDPKTGDARRSGSYSLRDAINRGDPSGLALTDMDAADMAADDLTARLIDRGIVDEGKRDDLVSELNDWLDFQIGYVQKMEPATA